MKIGELFHETIILQLPDSNAGLMEHAANPLHIYWSSPETSSKDYLGSLSLKQNPFSFLLLPPLGVELMGIVHFEHTHRAKEGF